MALESKMAAPHPTPEHKLASGTTVSPPLPKPLPKDPAGEPQKGHAQLTASPKGLHAFRREKERREKFCLEQEGGLLEVFWGQNKKRVMEQGDTQMVVLPH